MYDGDVLDGFDARRKPTFPTVPAELGLVVEDRSTGFCGDVVRTTIEAVTLRSRRNEFRHFRWKPGGFLLDGKPVTLVRPVAAPAAHAAHAVPRVTASGSIAAARRAPARIARASRVWVEGVHDAELVEHVWGDDLRDLGIVVEPMHGIDDLAGAVARFGPSGTRRLGILVDHLVAGSKESRLAATVRHPHVLVTGHPYVDVWAGVRPSAAGLPAWPDVPFGVPWKQGVCERLGVPFEGFWPKLRNRVRTYADLEAPLVGAVEQLIDFVTEFDPDDDAN